MRVLLWRPPGRRMTRVTLHPGVNKMFGAFAFRNGAVVANTAGPQYLGMIDRCDGFPRDRRMAGVAHVGGVGVCRRLTLRNCAVVTGRTRS